jgi:hypothetical protein
VLNQLAPDLWVAEKPLSVLGVHLGTRMTVVRLGSSGLFIHAPVPLTPDMQRQLDDLGPVQAVVAPSAMHHLYIGEYMRAYPKAQFFAAEGVAKKRPELRFHGVLGDRPEFLWGSDLDQLPIHGCPKLNEVAFLHRASHTLILTDWIFNFSSRPSGPEPGTADRPSLWTVLYLRMMGAYGGPKQSRRHRAAITDKHAARTSTDLLLTWDFDRIILAHGDIIETGGHAALQAATEWLRAPEPARPAAAFAAPGVSANER